jgi:hypothetical protein
MSKIDWTVYRDSDGLDVSQYVRGLDVSWGRTSPISPYAGRVATVVINNDNQQADLFTINSLFYVAGTVDVYGDIFTYEVFGGVVLTRDFDDAGGTGKGSICTITLVDSFTLAGNQQASVVIASTNNQIAELALLLTNPNQSMYGYWYADGKTDCAFTTGAFNGNIQSQIQQMVLADRGILQNLPTATQYYAPSQFDTLAVSIAAGNLTFGRTTTPTQIAYESIDRSEAASNGMWFNDATITGALTTGTKTNGSSAQYGVKSFTSTTTQTEKVNSTAEWYANNYISPNRLNLNMSILDIAQDVEALLLLLDVVLCNCGYFSDVSWTVPGGSSVTQTFFPDRVSINITAGSTRVNLGMTNINSYQNFILNSATFGILDTSRLGVGTAV